MTNWIKNLMTAFKWVGLAIAGRPLPMYSLSKADNKYFYPPADIVANAIHELAIMKVLSGFVPENYRPESWDCDNAALHDYNALLNNILPDLCSHIPDAQISGFSCGMFSFMRDNGKRHRVAYIEDDRHHRTFIDTYEINGTIIRKLSKSERAAGEDIT